MPIARKLAFALVLTASLGTSTAFAQSAADKKQALELFDQGKAAYREGRFQDSVELLQKAYGLVKEPVLLYNLARAHEGLGDFPAAIKAYEQYLSTEKNVPDRGAIEQKLTSLRRTVAEQARLAKERDEALKKESQPKPEEPAPRVAPGPRPAESPSPWPWVIAGVGAGALVAGAVTGGLALGKNGDAEAAPSQRETAELRSSAETFALASTALLIAGGVVCAAGATWGIIDVATLDGPQGDTAARVRIGPGGVWLVGAF